MGTASSPFLHTLPQLWWIRVCQVSQLCVQFCFLFFIIDVQLIDVTWNKIPFKHQFLMSLCKSYGFASVLTLFMGITLGFDDSYVTGLVANDSDFYP